MKRHQVSPGWRLRVVALGCAFVVIGGAGCATSGPGGEVNLSTIAPAARAKDYAATSEYLRARAREIRMTMANLPLDAFMAKPVIARARSECAGALRDTPLAAIINGQPGTDARTRAAALWLLLELEGSVLGRYTMTTGQAVAPSAAREFAAKVASLRWSDDRLTNLVRAYVGVEKQLFSIAPVDVCAAIRRWAASGYKAVVAKGRSQRPTGAIGRAWRTALRALGCRGVEIASEKTVLAVIRPYQRPRSAPTTRQIEQLEAGLGVAVLRSRQRSVDALMRVLGAPVRRRSVPAQRSRTLPLADCASSI